MSIGKHYETGESFPDDIYKKLLAARTFRAGSLSLRQVGASLPEIKHPLPPFAFRPYSCLDSFDFCLLINLFLACSLIPGLLLLYFSFI